MSQRQDRLDGVDRLERGGGVAFAVGVLERAGGALQIFQNQVFRARRQPPWQSRPRRPILAKNVTPFQPHSFRLTIISS